MGAIQVYQGDSKQINLTFTDCNGNPLNLSGYSLVFTAKRTFTDTGAAISVLQTGYVSAVSGMMSVFLSGSQTDICPGDYLATFSLIDSGSNVSTYNTDGLCILPALYKNT